MLTEAAKLAPAETRPDHVQDRELTKGNANRATLAVARKMVEFLVAVDRRGKAFETSKLAA